MLMSMRLKKPQGTVNGMIISGTATAGQIRFTVGATFVAGGDVGSADAGIGPYQFALPAVGPQGGAAPASTDPAGSTTINNLISAGGATVTIPGNVIYMVNAPIVIPTGKTLQAATGTSVTLRAVTAYASEMVWMNGVQGATLKNITIDGNWTQRSAQEDGNYGQLLILGGSGNTVQNCAFTNCPTMGIWEWSARATTIQYNTFSEVYLPIRFNGSTLVSNTGAVTGNTFYNSSAFHSIQALELLNTHNVNVMHNTFQGVGLAVPTSHGFEGTWGNSIYVVNSDATLVENNTCNPSYWSSLVLGAGATNSVVKRNYFSRGLSISAVTNTNSFWFEQPPADVALIQRNIFDGGFLIGDGGGNHATVEDNIINAYGGGIDASGTFTQGVIQRNTFNRINNAGNSPNGIYLFEKNASQGAISLSVLNNIFNGFPNGIMINNSFGVGAITGLTITGNSFSACATNISIPATISINFSTCNIQGFFGTSAGGSGSGYLFAARTDFPSGYGRGLKPTNYTNGQMDTAVRTQFNAWKAARINGPFTVTSHAQSVYAGAQVTGTYYDQFSSASKSWVSEGQGYSMLIFVIMAGYDANARTIFDGIFKMGRARPAFGQIANVAPSAKYLMEWYALPDLTSPNDGYNAADGDLDVALALLMADRQWGSTGSINYFQEALNTIGAIKDCNCQSTAGNTTGVPMINIGGSFRYATRTSDYMYDNFRQFALATGDTFWNTAITNCQTLITNIIAGYSPVSKLQPGWILDTTTSPIPSPAGASPDHSGLEGYYDYNACRNPWRWGTYYLMTGNATAKAHAGGCTAAINSEAGGNADSVGNYYFLNGAGQTPRYRNIAFTHGAAIGAMCGANAGDQTWLNTLMTNFTNNVTTGYFDTELTLLAMIVMSGNWWGRY